MEKINYRITDLNMSDEKQILEMLIFFRDPYLILVKLFFDSLFFLDVLIFKYFQYYERKSFD